jgi:hypothetical protein
LRIINRRSPPPDELPELPTKGTLLASVEELLSWHTEIVRGRRDLRASIAARKAAIEQAEIALAHELAIVDRYRTMWNHYLYLLGLSMAAESEQAALAPSSNDKGKARADSLGDPEDDDPDDTDHSPAQAHKVIEQSGPMDIS